MYNKKILNVIVVIFMAGALFIACLLSACFGKDAAPCLRYGQKHNLKFVPSNAATCSEEGNSEYYVCDCGKYFSDENALNEIARADTVLQLKPHTYSYGYDENSHYLECSVCRFKKSDTASAHVLKFSADEYSHHRYCTVCDYRTEDEEHVPDDEGDGFCKICRFRRPDYALSDDGGYYICTGASQAFKDQVSELIIPDTYMGLPVKEIGERAFAGCLKLEKVTLGKNVVTVGDYAFLDSAKLKTLELNDGLLEIRYRAFHGCRALEEVILPSSMVSMGNGVFYDCTSLKKVILPQGLKSIGERMFYQCASLESVELPSDISDFGTASFSRSGISEFTIPEGVAAVPQTMFYDCKNLETVTLPSSVTSIGSGAFMDCASLKKIIFQGSRQQWESITFYNMWDKNTDFEVEFLS